MCDGSEALLDSIAALVGVPVAHGETSLPPNVAADMVYTATRRRPTTRRRT
jgi:hypothetical protein